MLKHTLLVYPTLPLGSILSLAFPLCAVCLIAMTQMPSPSTSPVIISVLPVIGGTLMHHVISFTEVKRRALLLNECFFALKLLVASKVFFWIGRFLLIHP